MQAGGALTGVLEATIARMEESGAARCRIVAVLGPTISGPAYEVGSDLMTRFIDADPANERSSRRTGGPAMRSSIFRPISGLGFRRAGSARSPLSGAAPTPRKSIPASAARRTAAKRITRLISAITLTR